MRTIRVQIARSPLVIERAGGDATDGVLLDRLIAPSFGMGRARHDDGLDYLRIIRIRVRGQGRIGGGGLEQQRRERGRAGRRVARVSRDRDEIRLHPGLAIASAADGVLMRSLVMPDGQSVELTRQDVGRRRVQRIARPDALDRSIPGDLVVESTHDVVVDGGIVVARDPAVVEHLETRGRQQRSAGSEVQEPALQPIERLPRPDRDNSRRPTEEGVQDLRSMPAHRTWATHQDDGLVRKAARVRRIDVAVRAARLDLTQADPASSRHRASESGRQIGKSVRDLGVRRAPKEQGRERARGHDPGPTPFAPALTPRSIRVPHVVCSNCSHL